MVSPFRDVPKYLNHFSVILHFYDGFSLLKQTQKSDKMDLDFCGCFSKGKTVPYNRINKALVVSINLNKP